MSEYLAYGVEFAITQKDFVLLEKGPKHIPMDQISRIEVQGSQQPPAGRQPGMSTSTYVVGGIAVLCLLLGWVVLALVLGGISGYLYFRGPSTLQIFRAYAWGTGLSGENASFHVASHEVKMLKSAMSSFPNVTLQIGADTITARSAAGNNQPVSRESYEDAESSAVSEELNLDDTSASPSSKLEIENAHSNQDAQAIFEAGVRMYDEGDKKEAMLRVLEAIKVDPQHVDANLFVATCFYHLNPIKNAEEIFLATQRVLEVDPDNEDADQIRGGTLLAVGHHALENEDWQKATDSFIDAYSIDPTCGDLPEKLVHCAENAGLLPRAIGAFEARLKEEHCELKTRHLAGQSYAKLALDQDALAVIGMTQDEALNHAERHLSFVTQRDPDNVNSNYWLGCTYVMMAEIGKARRIVDILRNVSPEKAGHIEEMLT